MVRVVQRTTRHRYRLIWANDMATWFSDCKPNEVYIGCGVFAEFDGESIRLRDDRGVTLRIDHGGPLILSGALAEFQSNRLNAR